MVSSYLIILILRRTRFVNLDKTKERVSLSRCDIGVDMDDVDMFYDGASNKQQFTRNWNKQQQSGAISFFSFSSFVMPAVSYYCLFPFSNFNIDFYDIYIIDF